jgi:hypothetical protein
MTRSAWSSADPPASVEVRAKAASKPAGDIGIRLSSGRSSVPPVLRSRGTRRLEARPLPAPTHLDSSRGQPGVSVRASISWCWALVPTKAAGRSRGQVGAALWQPVRRSVEVEQRQPVGRLHCSFSVSLAPASPKQRRPGERVR